MKKRNKILANILMYVTILAPLPIYLFIMITFFNVKHDYSVDGIEISDLNVFIVEDTYYINTDVKSVIYDGLVAYTDDLGYVMIVGEDDIIKVDKKLYNVRNDLKGENEEALPLGLYEIDVKEIKKETKSNNNLSVAVYVAVVLVALIVIKKMQLEKKYPRIAVMIALTLGTAILYGLDKIIGDMLMVFVVATVSWAIYLIEYTVYFNKLSQHERAKLIADLERRR